MLYQRFINLLFLKSHVTRGNLQFFFKISIRLFNSGIYSLSVVASQDLNEVVQFKDI